MNRSKWLTSFFGLAIAGALMFGATAAHADTIPIQISGALNLTQLGGGTAQFTFGTVTATPNGDSINGAAVVLGGGFTLSGVSVGDSSASLTTDAPATLSINSGNGSGAGALSATVNYADIYQTGTGGYQVTMQLSNLSYTAGSSTLLAQFATAVNGTGEIDFGFVSGNTTLYALANSTSFTTKGFTGDITAVPEPASLALLGTGLLGLAFVFKRRFQADSL